jgi:hypothetical protein
LQNIIVLSNCLCNIIHSCNILHVTTNIVSVNGYKLLPLYSGSSVSEIHGGDNDVNKTLATLHEDEVRANFRSMQIRIAIAAVGSFHN